MEFRPEFVTPSTCTLLTGEVANAQTREEAHQGEHDYFESNKGIAFAEAQNGRKAQEDRFRCGPGPDKYFELSEQARKRMMKRICQLLQEKLTEQIPSMMLNRGSTVLIAIAKRVNNTLLIDFAHLGDSLAFLIIEDEQRKIVTFERLNSCLHHATDPIEQARILQAGGTVTGKRLGGILALSRALGNNRLNPPHNPTNGPLSRTPAFVNQVVELPANHTARLLISCDGLTEAFNTQKLCTAQSDTALARRLYQACHNLSLKNIPLALMHCAKISGSFDNLTNSIMEFLPDLPLIFQTLFDGHGGHEAAELARNLILSILNQAYQEALNPAQQATLTVELPPTRPSTPEPTPLLESSENENASKRARFNEPGRRTAGSHRTSSFFVTPTIPCGAVSNTPITSSLKRGRSF
jgi:serine/threonine protein phosphatase PrpC